MPHDYDHSKKATDKKAVAEQATAKQPTSAPKSRLNASEVMRDAHNRQVQTAVSEGLVACRIIYGMQRGIEPMDVVASFPPEHHSVVQHVAMRIMRSGPAIQYWFKQGVFFMEGDTLEIVRPAPFDVILGFLNFAPAVPGYYPQIPPQVLALVEGAGSGAAKKDDAPAEVKSAPGAQKKAPPQEAGPGPAPTSDWVAPPALEGIDPVVVHHVLRRIIEDGSNINVHDLSTGNFAPNQINAILSRALHYQSHMVRWRYGCTYVVSPTETRWIRPAPVEAIASFLGLAPPDPRYRP